MSNGSSGKWVSLTQYNPDEICSICQEPLGTQQAIYKTPCNHLFHNNCLNQYCEMEGRMDPQTGTFTLSCPLCRSNLDENICNDVWAFREKVLGTPLPFQNDPHILHIYEGLPPQQGGKRKKMTRRKRKVTKRKRKTRKNKKTNKRR